MPVVAYIVAIVVGYLLGSIPTGFLVAKSRGIDIRTVGSGNIGATNVVRTLGKSAGAAVLLADALKGWLAAAVAAKIIGGWFFHGPGPAPTDGLCVCAGIAAILGHNYTCWLNFKGGKGIATSAGVVLGLAWLALALSLGIWIIVFAISRYVSLASIAAAFALPFAMWIDGKSTTLILVMGALGALAIFKHKTNIKRLLEGSESRFGRKKPVTQAPSGTA